MNILNNILDKKLKFLLTALAATFVVAFIGILSISLRTNAIPYGPDAPPSPVPAFNVYTGVPNEGNEKDFFKGKVDGTTEASVNNVVGSCETGSRFSLRAYVHNGASQYNNGTGNGPSVAKNTKIKVSIPGNEASKFEPNATISASNASSISDGMTITCSDGRKVTMKYVAGSAEQYSPKTGIQPVSDSIVTTGAPIGTKSPNGDLWGCWDQRVYVRLVVVVTEVKPVLHPAVCDALLTTLLANNQVRVDDVEYTENDAKVNSIAIDYGDSNKVTVQPNGFPVQHTYAKPGTYTIKATLKTTFEGKSKDVTSKHCEKKVTIEPEPEIVKICKIADVTKLSRVSYKITAKAEVQNTTVEKYTFTTKNDKGDVVDTKEVVTNKLTASYNFYQVNPGKYTVKAVIQTTDGQAEGKCETEIIVDNEPTTPEYSCDNFSLSFNDRKATVSFIATASKGAVFKDATIVYISNGAEKEIVTTDKVNTEGKVVSMYTFDAEAQHIDANAVVRFNVPVDGKTVVKQDTCGGQAVLGVETPEIPEVPGKPVTPVTTIPDTGAGSIAGIMVAVTAAGTTLHRRMTLNRK